MARGEEATSEQYDLPPSQPRSLPFTLTHPSFVHRQVTYGVICSPVGVSVASFCGGWAIVVDNIHPVQARSVFEGLGLVVVVGSCVATP